ncbi:MAG TPA: nucleoside deaminase [Parafilimonas sp.]|nr:nucleoside deaminase [Parafilimonas sp.]
MLNDEHYMQQALREAQKALEEDEIPIGCVIVINQKIIARAHNMTEQLNDSTAHAEILALTSAYNFLGSKYLPDAVLYVTVEPCLMCAGAMYWSKLEYVVWGADDKKNGYRHITESNSPFHPKTKIRTGVLKNECAELMQTFFQQKRR